MENQNRLQRRLEAFSREIRALGAEVEILDD